MIFYLLQELVEKVLMLFYLKLLELPIGIAVDTHCKRISNRIGLSNETDPSKIEQDLIKQIDKKYFSKPHTMQGMSEIVFSSIPKSASKERLSKCPLSLRKSSLASSVSKNLECLTPPSIQNS